MTRDNMQANDKATTTNNWKTLAQWSQGVTTLHHYERISSRDLEWHRREDRREREEVKLSFFFDKQVKPKNLEKLNKLKERIQRR